MKILQVLNSPHWSGASHYCILLGQQLRGLGHEVLLLTEPGKALDRARLLGIHIDDTIRLNHRNPGLFVHSMKRFKTIYREFKPDIISAHINEGAWMAGLLARWFAPEATVVRVRTDIDPPKGHFINRFVHNRWTDHIIVSSFLHKHACQKLLDFPAEGIDVVYGPVDTDVFKPNPKSRAAIRREFEVDERTILIGMVARLDPVKGHEYALQAIKLLDRKQCNFKLVLLGYENERTFSWIKQLAAELGLKDLIACFGFRQDLPAVINAFDIGLVSSIGSEANCRVALEMMASGKPVVATTVGVIPEIIADGEDGFLVPPRDPVAMARAMTRLIQNPLLRNKMGLAAREKVGKNFNLDLFARQAEKAYQKAIARRAASRTNS